MRREGKCFQCGQHFKDVEQHQRTSDNCIRPSQCPHQELELVSGDVQGYGSMLTAAILECQRCGGLYHERRHKIQNVNAVKGNTSSEVEQ